MAAAARKQPGCYSLASATPAAGGDVGRRALPKNASAAAAFAITVRQVAPRSAGGNGGGRHGLSHRRAPRIVGGSGGGDGRPRATSRSAHPDISKRCRRRSSRSPPTTPRSKSTCGIRAATRRRTTGRWGRPWVRLGICSGRPLSTSYTIGGRCRGRGAKSSVGGRSVFLVGHGPQDSDFFEDGCFARLFATTPMCGVSSRYGRARPNRRGTPNIGVLAKHQA